MVLWSSFQSIRQNNAAHLTNLVNFGLAAVTLEVDPVVDAVLSENMVAAPYSFFETELVKQLAQIVEVDVRI
jgi:hypothetical protein